MLTMPEPKPHLRPLPLVLSFITVAGLRAVTQVIPKISPVMVMENSTTTGFPLGIETATADAGAKLQGDYCGQLWQGLLANNEFVIADQYSWRTVPNVDIVYWYGAVDITDPNAYCIFNYVSDDRSFGSENWDLKYYPFDGRTIVGRSTLSQ